MDTLRLVKLKGLAKIEKQIDPKKEDGSLLLKGYALKITLLENNADQVSFTLPGVVPMDGIVYSEGESVCYLDELPVIFNTAWFNKFPSRMGNTWGGEQLLTVFIPAEMHSPGKPGPGEDQPKPGEDKSDKVND